MNQVEYKIYEDKIKTDKAIKGHEAIASERSFSESSGPHLKKTMTVWTGLNDTAKQDSPEKATFTSTSKTISAIQKLLLLLLLLLSAVPNEVPQTNQQVTHRQLVVLILFIL